MYYAYEVTLVVTYNVDSTEKAEEIRVALREYFTTEQMSRIASDGHGRIVRFWCPEELTPEQMFIVETITGQKYRKTG